MHLSPDSLDPSQRESLAQARKDCAADILTMTTVAASGHPGGSLSTLDALLVAYGLYSVDPNAPMAPHRDRIFISHGHVSPAVYATLGLRGFVDPAEARARFRAYGSRFGGHIETTVPGVEWNTGNLGQGLSLGVGSALHARLAGKHRTCVFLGDGEQQKGQLAEARRTAVKFGLGSLTAVVDWNGLQIGGAIGEVMPQDIAADWAAAGWKVLHVDGHNFDALHQAFVEAMKGASGNQPTLILAKTVMGKGVPFMENLAKYHGAPLSEEQCTQALTLLGHPHRLEQAKRDREAFLAQAPEPESHIWPAVPPPQLEVGRVDPRPLASQSDCRSAFGLAMEDLARLNNDTEAKVVAFSCDLEGSVKLNGFHAASPEAFFECGIQEHSTATVAGRMAREGHSVFFSTFGMFAVTEVFNQLRLNDFNRSHLKVVATHCGLDVGMDGPTHQCVDYVGLLRSTMGWEIFVAADANQCEHITRWMAGQEGCQFLGMGRSKLPTLSANGTAPYYDSDYCFQPGVADCLHQGSDGAIIACGPMVHSALQAAHILAEQHGRWFQVWNSASIRPLDTEMVTQAAATGLILTAEDHHPDTGLGGAIANVLSASGGTAKLVRLGVEHFGSSGPPEKLYAAFGLDAAGIVRVALEQQLTSQNT